MKISYNPKENNLEIETSNLLSFCYICGNFIGSVEIVKGSEVGQYTLQIPICYSCYKKHFPNQPQAKPKTTF